MRLFKRKRKRRQATLSEIVASQPIENGEVCLYCGQTARFDPGEELWACGNCWKLMRRMDTRRARRAKR